MRSSAGDHFERWLRGERLPHPIVMRCFHSQKDSPTQTFMPKPRRARLRQAQAQNHGWPIIFHRGTALVQVLAPKPFLSSIIAIIHHGRALPGQRRARLSHRTAPAVFCSLRSLGTQESLPRFPPSGTCAAPRGPRSSPR